MAGSGGGKNNLDRGKNMGKIQIIVGRESTKTSFDHQKRYNRYSDTVSSVKWI